MAKQKIDEGFLNAMKFCVYPTNEKDKSILIPENLLEEGSQELSVRYLISTYGFKIQSVIPGSVEKKNHFEPPLKEKINPIRKGLRYRRLSDGYLYEVFSDVDEDGFVTIRDVEGKGKDKQYQQEDILKLLKSGKYAIMKNKQNGK